MVIALAIMSLLQLLLLSTTTTDDASDNDYISDVQYHLAADHLQIGLLLSMLLYNWLNPTSLTRYLKAISVSCLLKPAASLPPLAGQTWNGCHHCF